MTDTDRWITAAGAALVALLVIGAVLVVVLLRGRRRERAEVHELRIAVAALTERLASPAVPVPLAEPEFVITGLADSDADVARADARSSGAPALVRTSVPSEPMVRAIALGHGVRRALAPETRNRIRFEVRREVKRARKSRRREMRDAWREMKTRRDAPEEPGRDVA